MEINRNFPKQYHTGVKVSVIISATVHRLQIELHGNVSIARQRAPSEFWPGQMKNF